MYTCQIMLVEADSAEEALSYVRGTITHAEIVTDINTPEQSAEIIGRACEKVMTKVGQKIG